jgi:threonine/homoserine/homoserine lactone efflux protein
MVSSGAVVGILVLALVLVLTPGPNMMYLVSRTLTQGRRAGVISLAGVAVGFLVYLTATNLGLAAVFVAVPELYLSVRIAGAAYLLWLAYKTLRPGGVSVFEPAADPRAGVDSPRRLFAMGLMTNLLNPKVAVLYLSLIPQFERPARGHLVWQGFELGLLQITVALIGNLTILVTAAAIARGLRRRPTWLRMQRYVMGTVLGALAIKLLTDSASPARPSIA